jgi:hypothetical protein
MLANPTGSIPVNVDYYCCDNDETRDHTLAWLARPDLGKAGLQHRNYQHANKRIDDRAFAA